MGRKKPRRRGLCQAARTSRGVPSRLPATLPSVSDLLYSRFMTLIAKTDELAAFCERQAKAEFVTVDTEFMRDRTYWPILCLVQIGGPDEGVAGDPMAERVSLPPLFAVIAIPQRR